MTEMPNDLSRCPYVYDAHDVEGWCLQTLSHYTGPMTWGWQCSVPRDQLMLCQHSAIHSAHRECVTIGDRKRRSAWLSNGVPGRTLSSWISRRKWPLCVLKSEKSKWSFKSAEKCNEVCIEVCSEVCSVYIVMYDRKSISSASMTCSWCVAD